MGNDVFASDNLLHVIVSKLMFPPTRSLNYSQAICYTFSVYQFIKNSGCQICFLPCEGASTPDQGYINILYALGQTTCNDSDGLLEQWRSD